ncbi:MAG: hypothetical protein ACI4QV_04435, partial [Acutalibacteraceae bacterium]
TITVLQCGFCCFTSSLIDSRSESNQGVYPVTSMISTHGKDSLHNSKVFSGFSDLYGSKSESELFNANDIASAKR